MNRKSLLQWSLMAVVAFSCIELRAQHHEFEHGYAIPRSAYGEFSHTEDIVSRLEHASNEFCVDLYYNYRHNPGFSETYPEAYQILQTAKFIHSAEHLNDREAIRSKLQGLDTLFHHVEEDVQGWSRIHQRQVGNLGIIRKMEVVEALLHHLMHDSGVAASIGGGQGEAPAPFNTAEGIAPPPTGVAPVLPPPASVEQSAQILEKASNDLCVALHRNFRHVPEFQETYREAYAILETAKFIHAAEHIHDHNAIRSKLNGIDKEFHHVAEDIRGWTSSGHSVVHLESKLAAVERSIHSIMKQLNIPRSAGINPLAGVPAVDDEIAPPPAP